VVIMENKIFCQSCGMPMSKDTDFGTDIGGVKNDDYCVYCYKDGKFTEDVTMDAMIERRLRHYKEFREEVKKEEGNFIRRITEWGWRHEAVLNLKIAEDIKDDEEKVRAVMECQLVVFEEKEKELRERCRALFPTFKRWKVA